MDRTTQYGGRQDLPKGDGRPRLDDTDGRGAGPATEPYESGSGERTAWLLDTIEAEIIPRLMLAHRTQPHAGPQRSSLRTGPTSDEIEEFSNLCLVQDASASLAYVVALRDEGLTLEEIYLDLLTPAARRLGALWETDDRDFTEVTIGLWRMQQVMYELSPSFRRETDHQPGSRSALLAPAPGSQHTLGVFMVAEFFRRAGWNVSGEPAMSARELIQAVSHDWYDVAGLSVGAELHIDGLTQFIADLRRASRNKALAIMVGGPIFVLHPEFVALTGADGTASDASKALTEAEKLVMSSTAAMPRRADIGTAA